MTRPIVWALGTLVSIGLSTSLTGRRLAEFAGTLKPQRADAASPAPARPPASPATLPERRLVVEGDRRGHFLVRPRVEGADLVMLVDTGASTVALTAEDAARAGIRPGPGEFTITVSTANGMARAAPVRLREVRVGEIVVRDVEATVMTPGRSGTSLLGMSFLRRLRGFEIADGKLTLRG